MKLTFFSKRALCRTPLAMAALCVMLVWADRGRSQEAPAEQPASDSAALDADTIAAKKHFVSEVLPILENKCFGCHGKGETLEGSLNLTSREAILQGGDTGPAMEPGSPETSLLYQAVLRDGDYVMPPQDRNALSKLEIADLEKWIAADAPWATYEEVQSLDEGQWDAGSADGVVVATSGGQSDVWTNRRYAPEDVWAYQPIRNPDVPQLQTAADGEIHPIDAFILDRLQEKGIDGLAPPADRRTLIRRLTYDLTGLPATPQETADFVSDDSPHAYDRLVARLLDSPHYGERMAQHWLDVVRYADTGGFANDFERPNAWRYRDYVIRSFNEDKPFDRFIVEQIAGDELDSSDPELEIAVGMPRMGPWEHTGMSVATVTRQQYLDDVTHNVGVTFLGQGMRCAQCHDHKFDPLPTKDYYRLQAVFAPVQFADRTVEYLPEENISQFDDLEDVTRRRLQDAKDFLAELDRKSEKALKEFLEEAGVKSLDELPEDERPHRRHIGLTELELSLEKVNRKRVDYFERELKRYEPYAFSLYSGPPRTIQSNKAIHEMPPKKQREGSAEETYILEGGALEAPGEKVDPGVLSAMAGSNDTLESTDWNTIRESTRGRRLDLAHWIASPKNTLTARVIVNRIWQRHFGTGIVATPNNFGKMGAKPTHPELLDWLATWFMENGWSIKKLDQLIVTSQTYRQASGRKEIPQLREIDSKNSLLAYFPTRRLTAEELRDSLLAVTGELNPEMGGPGCHPEINWEVATQPRHIMGSVAPAYIPDPLPEQRHRRTIYAFRTRGLPNPLMEVFNQPGSDTSCERRDETTVVSQAFSWLNGKFVNDRAMALADRIAEEANGIDAQVNRAFQLVYGRQPTAEEGKAASAHLREMRNHHRSHEPEAFQEPMVVHREMVEELTGEPFSWEEELIGMEDFVPDLKPTDVDAQTRALAELCLVLMNSNEFVYVR